MESLIHNLTHWLNSHLEDHRKDGFILGISGGVDSCVLTHLLHNADIPYQSIHYLFDENEISSENTVISFLRNSTALNIKVDSLEQSYAAAYRQICEDPEGTFENYLFRTILKSKLSHIDLSYKANKNNFLVLGTINLDEFLLGYFVKNTCVGDLLPFAAVPKKVIRNLGISLGIPEYITRIKASGCVYGTYAEEEWGISEDELYFLVSGQADRVGVDQVSRFNSMVDMSAHKRSFVPIFMPGDISK